MKVGRVRRVEKKNAASLRQLAQCRLKQRQFTYAFMAGHEFDQSPLGPAPARQFGIEPCKAGADDRQPWPRHLCAAPQGGVYVLRLKACHGISLILFKYTV